MNNDFDIETLRMRLLQNSLNFLNKLRCETDKISFVSFVEVEKRRMIQIINATPQTLSALDIIQKSGE